MDDTHCQAEIHNVHYELVIAGFIFLLHLDVNKVTKGNTFSTLVFNPKHTFTVHSRFDKAY